MLCHSALEQLPRLAWNSNSSPIASIWQYIGSAKTFGSLVSGMPSGEDLSSFHEFNVSNGVGEHCSLGAEPQLAQVVFEWLEEQWAD